MLLSEVTHSGFKLAPAFTPPIDSERRLLGLLFRHGELTQAEITRAIGLTQSMVSRLVSGLQAKGMIGIGARLPNGRGQPSPALHLKPDYTYTLGVSLLADAISFDLMDFAGTLLWRGHTAMPSMSQAAVREQLARFKASMLSESGIDERRLFAAGVGISAFFVGDGALMNPPALLDDWALVDIAPVVSEVLGLPVLVDNDGNVATIGEGLRGAGRRFRHLAYFQITNGFGGGLIVNGQPFRGAYGNAGEFAALWQCLGIEHPNLERLRLLLKAHGVDFATVSELIAELDVAHPGVEAWLAEAGPAFSLAATGASAVIDCEAIVLGGRIPRSLAEKLAARIHIAGTNRRDRPRPLPEIVISETPGDAVSLGAAVFALQSTFFS